MAATLDTAALASHLDGCPVLTSEGRLFPVTIRYESPPLREPVARSMAAAIERTAEATAGDVLAFLPGVGEIRQTATELEEWARARGVIVVPLYGGLPDEQQDLALT